MVVVTRSLVGVMSTALVPPTAVDSVATVVSAATVGEPVGPTVVTTDVSGVAVTTPVPPVPAEIVVPVGVPVVESVLGSAEVVVPAGIEVIVAVLPPPQPQHITSSVNEVVSNRPFS